MHHIVKAEAEPRPRPTRPACGRSGTGGLALGLIVPAQLPVFIDMPIVISALSAIQCGLGGDDNDC